MLKVTVSGSYYSGTGARGKEIVDYEGVVIVIPEIEEHRIQQAVMWRLIQIAISKDPKFTKRFDTLRHCYIDKVEKVAGKPSIIGKDIKEMTWEELEELAVWKNLRQIPIYKTTDLRFAREKAYLEYSALIDKKLDPEEEGYNYAALPELVIEDDDKVAIPEKQKTNEEIIAGAQEDTGLAEDPTFTLKELKALAKKQKIALPANVKYDEAYRLVIGGKK